MPTSLVTWNVNGIRSYIVDNLDSKKFKNKTAINPESSLGAIVFEVDPDIICMQETRCSTENMLEFKIPDWQIFSVSSKLDGARSANRYSGTCIWVKQSFGIPTSVIPYLSTLPTEHYLNNEGRYLELHFKNLIIINTYVPNLGGSMSVESNRSGNTDTEYLFEHNDRLLKWDTALKEHLLNLKKSKKRSYSCR